MLVEWANIMRKQRDGLHISRCWVPSHPGKGNPLPPFPFPYTSHQIFRLSFILTYSEATNGIKHLFIFKWMIFECVNHFWWAYKIVLLCFIYGIFYSFFSRLFYRPPSLFCGPFWKPLNKVFTVAKFALMNMNSGCILKGQAQNG